MLRIAMVYSDMILLDFLRTETAGEVKPIRYSQMVATTGISLSTVKRGLRRLERSGVIVREFSPGYECRYQVKQQ